ncbi:MAG: hypothetical protein QXL18_04360 [Candidatus Woesearchaeota archaeon]
MNKTIKKIVALGVGATMLLGTGASAYAATLSDYPAPFVQNGVFVGKIVIGEKANVIDVLGATDIAASLQRASAVSVTTTSGSTTAMAEDGYKFSESRNLILGANLNSVISVVDDTELPELLKSGTIEADDGSEYDYDVEIHLPSGSEAVVSANMNDNDLDDYKTPLAYFNLGTGSDLRFYDVVIDFQDSWSASDFTNSEAIELFGRAYTFDQKNSNNNSVLTLYGSDTTLLVGKGETKTITYNGKEYTVEVLGGNADAETAILRVGSDTRTVKEGDSRTIGGLPLYVKDVFISTIGTQDISVMLFLGSNKIELNANTNKVRMNGKDVKAYFVNVTKSGTGPWQDVQKITFTVTPEEDDVEYILPGEEYVDPLFGSFKFHFVGAEDLKAGKEELKFARSGKKLDVTFTPRGANKATTFTLLDGNVTKDFWGSQYLDELERNKYFVYNENSGDDTKAVTHLLRIESVSDGMNVSSNDFELVVRDLTFEKTYTIKKCQTLDSKIPLYPESSTVSNRQISFTSSSTCNGAQVTHNPVLYTKDGSKVLFWTTNTTNDSPLAVVAHAGQLETDLGFIQVIEDVDNDKDDTTPTNFIVKYSYDFSDNEYDVSFYAKGNSSLMYGPLTQDDDADHYLTEFGTYVYAETDDKRYVSAYIPAKEVTYDMFLLPVESSVTVTSTSGGSAVALNPIAVGMAIMDTDATLGSKPYIVVGGPCANTVAAELMGNPSDCAAGFTEGKAMIKLFSDKNALLVAGYSGKDTQGASRVLANYKDYAFSGTELEVTTTNLNSLSVKRLS